MPAYVSSRQALACKLVTFYPNNTAKDLDTHMAHVLLFDETSGEIKAVISITNYNSKSRNFLKFPFINARLWMER